MDWAFTKDHISCFCTHNLHNAAFNHQ